MYDYLIVGAGLYGAVFAQEARRAGKHCLVIDRRPHIGGNAYTESIQGIDVHRYGAHIFHTGNPQVWAYVQRFGAMNDYINMPVASYKGRFYNLPFNMHTFQQIWGVNTPEEAQAELARQRQKGPQGAPQNLEEKALQMVGPDLYEILVKGYTEKQWGRPCHELPAFLIERLPLRFTFDNNYFNDPYQGIPKQGYTKLTAAMLEGTEVRLGVDYLAERATLRPLARQILYTGPIDEYFGYVYGALDYRCSRFETQLLPDVADYQGNAVVNHTDAAVPYTRVIEHKHFTFGKQPHTVITHEYPEEWTRGKEPYYPVNDAKNQALYQRYRSLAQSQAQDILFGGRLGEYRYYDMDEVVEKALALCQALWGA